MKECADQLLPVTLELGGKGAIVVFEEQCKLRRYLSLCFLFGKIKSKDPLTLCGLDRVHLRRVGGLFHTIFHAESAPLPGIFYFMGKTR